MPADDILLECEEHMEKAVEHMRHELRSVRTGRATPALVENIKVDYYGSPTELRSIASISVPEATQLLIKPFSPQDLKSIEKAINDSKIGLTPHSDGKQLRLMLPPLSQERRTQLAGQCKGFAEFALVGQRLNLRERGLTRPAGFAGAPYQPGCAHTQQQHQDYKGDQNTRPADLTRNAPWSKSCAGVRKKLLAAGPEVV